MGIHLENFAELLAIRDELMIAFICIVLAFHLNLRARHRRAKTALERVRGERDELRDVLFNYGDKG